jgi:hypothetical protein
MAALSKPREKITIAVIAIKTVLKRCKKFMSDWSVKAMTLDVFWERIETALALAVNRSNCDICPVQQYAKETNTERICDKVGDCADGLMMLHKKLQEEERQKMDKEREE